MTTDSAASAAVPTRSTVTASDGVTLAVHAYTEIDPQRPTVLAIHGYPDNHHLWDGVAQHLAGRYNFVAYDVRGAGESARPAGRPNYRFPQLISDTGAVIDSLGVGRVHLLAHDWGSIQAWAAVTEAGQPRWDGQNLHAFTGTYGDYLLGKVSKVFPQLRREVLADETP